MLKKLRYFNRLFGQAIFLRALEKIMLSEFGLISLHITWKEHSFVLKIQCNKKSGRFQSQFSKDLFCVSGQINCCCGSIFSVKKSQFNSRFSEYKVVFGITLLFKNLSMKQSIQVPICQDTFALLIYFNSEQNKKSLN